MQIEGNHDYFLWKRIKSGDAEAFQELYNLYADILFSFGTIFTRDHELVKDCMHDLIFDLYKYRKNLSDNDNIRNYLFKSLKRKIQTSGKKSLRLVYSENLTSESDNLHDNVDPDELDEQQAQMSKVNCLINELPEKQREILNLKFQLEMPYHEIAVIMDISVESVRTSVYRSIKTIREQMEGQELMFLFIFMKKSGKIV
ncbi:RNA polymerase sigma factor [Mangrovibacterium diazotrophicum]|uniref:RNA polymerase sigma factor (Sigma-70 family) n=1 Tax=Mangrovibacterium diazotrophicum TaxID=1261403 RepID=A0A419W5L8_9BACT|nr:sigma-70 family RNA polymerase sigma factor [Mangrovibacterium diazotrophicum]RKD90759.1 RNA polymerase sigma factor (sigma-70 family) [Mangrovibacterium diazotrophicum]